MEFFKSAVNLKLKHSKLTAFGSTRRAGVDVSVHIESTNGEKVWGTVGVSTRYQQLMHSYRFFKTLEYLYIIKKANHRKYGLPLKNSSINNSTFGLYL